MNLGSKLILTNEQINWITVGKKEEGRCLSDGNKWRKKYTVLVRLGTLASFLFLWEDPYPLQYLPHLQQIHRCNLLEVLEWYTRFLIVRHYCFLWGASPDSSQSSLLSNKQLLSVLFLSLFLSWRARYKREIAPGVN